MQNKYQIVKQPLIKNSLLMTTTIANKRVTLQFSTTVSTYNNYYNFVGKVHFCCIIYANTLAFLHTMFNFC